MLNSLNNIYATEPDVEHIARDLHYYEKARTYSRHINNELAQQSFSLTRLMEKTFTQKKNRQMLHAMINHIPNESHHFFGGAGIFSLGHDCFYVSFNNEEHRVLCGEKYNVVEEEPDGTTTASVVEFFPKKFTKPVWHMLGGDSQIVMMQWLDNTLSDSTAFGPKETFASLLGTPPLNPATEKPVSVADFFDGFKYVDHPTKTGKHALICSLMEGGRGFGMRTAPYELDSEPIQNQRKPIFKHLMRRVTRIPKRKEKYPTV